MIEVQMDQLTTEADALRAALASVLEVPLDEVPDYQGLAADMQYEAWLGAELNLGRFRVGEMRPPNGYWLARVPSPYPAYRTHTLVMQHARIVYDPHPEPQPIDLTDGSLLGELLVPLDPSLPSGRHAM